ncbi:MFS transporter [uncultured Dialister sp.]|uniref:MFS transporter n=3 Tax=Dialister TaxID=39948 RepID=UPI002676478E|nr:MFS transporter [uncultured Dialister sp.]
MGWLKKFQSENRYVVFFFLYVGFCISYIDRSAIGLALPSISKDFALAPTQMGVVISAFFIGYSIMQLPGGWMADKFGSKSVILIALTLWSIFTFTTGHASSLAGLLFLRFVFGLCEGPYAGACYRGIAEYFPRELRPAFATGVLSSNYIGSAIAPIIIVPLILWFGWRGMFQALGCIGLVYVFFYAFFVKQVKPAEEEKAGAKKGSKKEYFLKLLHFSIIWKLVVCAFCISRINKGLDAWMPTYLIAERGINLKAVGYVIPIPFMASFLSTAVCGWIMNKYFDRVEQYMIGICAVMTAVFLYLMYNAETLFWVVVFQCGVYFFKACILGSAVAIVLKIVTGNIAGSATMIVNMGGQVAGFISPVVMGYLVSVFNGSFNAVFYYLIGAASVCALSAFLIPKRKEAMLDLGEGSEE